MSNRVFVTGGTGFIGSHAITELSAEGHAIYTVDSLANSRADVITALQSLCHGHVGFSQLDIRDCDELTRVMRDFRPDVVIHFAGLKSVADSASDPLGYYESNVAGSLSLLRAMSNCGVRRIVFSSSATVYGTAMALPIDEGHALSPESVYGRTKLHVEQILADLCAADPTYSAAILRYFNPVGCHPTALIGEWPMGRPANLLPFVSQVAAGIRPEVVVYGNDYDTIDGTGVRDYIHVLDLARAHARALQWTGQKTGARTFNLGVGRGLSVMEILTAYGTVLGRPIPYALAPRRTGDVAISYADASRAEAELGWKAVMQLSDICESAWAWQQAMLLAMDDAPLLEARSG